MAAKYSYKVTTRPGSVSTVQEHLDERSRDNWELITAQLSARGEWWLFWRVQEE